MHILTTASAPARTWARTWAPASALVAAASVLAAGPASAQTYPTRPITLVVGFTAGGPTDIPARFIAQRLATSLGTPVVVENKPGAASMLATYDVLAAPRDGHRLLVCTYFDPVNTLLYSKARYKVSDLAPVTLIVRYDYAIAVRADMPIKTFGDLIQYAKANPGKLNYGQLGIGSTQNILAKSLEKLTGAKMTAVTFKGAADATREVVAGRIDLFIGPPFVILPQYEAKKIKLAAVTGKERLRSAPDVPTLTEGGIPLVAYAWLGVCAGSGTPQPIIDRLSKEIGAIVQSKDYRALIEKSGSVAISSTPQEMQAVIDESVRQAAPLIEEFGLKLN